MEEIKYLHLQIQQQKISWKFIFMKVLLITWIERQICMHIGTLQKKEITWDHIP